MQVLFRQNHMTQSAEYKACSKHFDTVSDMVSLERGATVLMRYSVIPLAIEVYRGLDILGCKPINNYSQHCGIANMTWIDAIKDLTFETWRELWRIPDEMFPIILKGVTNSRKERWNEMMFADSREKASTILCNLLNDPIIGTQEIVYRRYVPLVTYEIGIGGVPMTNEWRVFFLNGTVVDYGYYWDILDDWSAVNAKHFRDSGGLKLAKNAAQRLKNTLAAPFLAIDVAEGQDGKWYVVEVNDGQMAGLTSIDPDHFYTQLRWRSYCEGYLN